MGTGPSISAGYNRSRQRSGKVTDKVTRQEAGSLFHDLTSGCVQPESDKTSPSLYKSCLQSQRYCRVPARWGLQQTSLVSGQRQDMGSGTLWSIHRWTILAITTDKNLKKKWTVHLTRFLLRQGEPGTSQYLNLPAPMPYLTYEGGCMQTPIMDFRRDQPTQCIATI